MQGKIETYMRILAAATVIFFCGLFLGQNQGLRKQDAFVIHELRNNVQNLTKTNQVATYLLNTVAKKDSVGAAIIKQEMQRLSKK